MSEFSSSQRHCLVFKWRPLWSSVSLGCGVVSWYPGDLFCLPMRLFLPVSGVCLLFKRGWFVFLQILSTEALLMRHIHTPQDDPFVRPMATTASDSYIILSERFYLHPKCVI